MVDKVLRIVLVPKYSFDGENFGDGSLYATAMILMEYFKKCIASTKYTSVDYFYEMNPAEVTNDDLVCYMLANQNRSIVAKKAPGQAIGGSGSTFYSKIDTAVISEIYMDTTAGDGNRYKLVANIIFHELLHNRLDAGPAIWQNVHNVVNGVLTTSKPITSYRDMSAADAAAMRRGLAHPRKQYPGGM